MIDKHRLPIRAFDALAVGRPDPETVRTLRNAALSKQMLRLHVLLESSESFDRSAFDLLAEVQRKAPEAVAEVLLYPNVVAWAAACLSRSYGSSADRMAVAADFTHLGGIAAAAVLSGGLDLPATVPVRRGLVALPGLGCAEIGTESVDGTARVRPLAGGGAEISTGHRTVVLPADPEAVAPGWHGLRRLSSTHGGRTIVVLLDDLDPFRDTHRLGAAVRLPTAAVENWRRALDGAWEILTRHHPERAAALAAGLRVVTPLEHRGGGRERSASSADAPGALAATLPGDPLLLAETLVHEFQHDTLSALLDLVPLHRADPEERLYAPWRDDPRPLGGLFQGAYAYLGVTDFWGRLQAESTGPDASYAQYTFALWRDQTRRAIDSIRRSGGITEAGTRFVAGMYAALEEWAHVPVPAMPRRLAQDTAAEHTLTWRLRHLRPDPGWLEPAAAAWPGGTVPAPAGPPVLAPAAGSGPSGARAELRRLWLRRPAEFARATGHPGDRAQVAGDYEEALGHYAVGPASAEEWAALAVCARRVDAGPAAEVLVTLPETVAAVHREIVRCGGDPPEPLELARWLGPVLAAPAGDWTSSVGLA
ncbi:hypothetical protein DPM19_22560 [Actinomadura craniellae]|uniref:HEXXH motif domain-containing protein n=1 Tax=Actinomadura craniellae TaxID=2231787 RepID=A0A365H135_9ACTN|nr:HEXXH motif domain-containing protein [Actinomadura craniellae]RAY12805.1 hypothetical protein DPM19_22560 [Actinomadura craniellae]